MPAAPESNRSALSIILDPLRDRNFRRLFRFLIIWNFALNLAVPFFAVYMLTRLGLSLPVVIGFTMLSQVTNVLFVRVWGAMADRLGSKTVMSLSASLYLPVIIGWIFTTNPEPHAITIPLLVALHIFAGVAAAGVLLTVQTLALKTAPTGKATPYVGLANIATGLGAGISPIIGGALADFFSRRLFRIDLTWASPSGLVELPALTMTGHDFLMTVAGRRSASIPGPVRHGVIVRQAQPVAPEAGETQPLALNRNGPGGHRDVDPSTPGRGTQAPCGATA